MNTPSILAAPPKTVIHFITVAFRADATPEQIHNAYADSDAQKKLYEIYLPIYEQSTTFDVTN